MNIFLIPFTWARHWQFAFWSGLFGLICWWLYLVWIISFGAWWSSSLDSFVTSSVLIVSTIASQILGEGSLRRWSLKEMGKKFGLGLLYSSGLSIVFLGTWNLISASIFSDVGNIHHIVALKVRLGDIISSGLVTAGTLLALQRATDKNLYIHYLLAGLFAGLGAGAIWSIFGYYIFQNLYWAGAMLCMGFGFFFGLAARSIPDDLYVGWIRIVAGSRFGHRIPIDAKQRLVKERFLGSYPNGLDMYIPPTEQVQELHTSIVHNPHNDTYILRGLSQQHTKMKRFLEWAKLDYNPTSPVPNEVVLQNEDMVEIGEQISFEFLILPKEER